MSQVNQPAVELARSRLAGELGCTDAEIALIDVEAVEWNDSALGCPKPGLMYMQVITPGFRITLAHNQQHYVYHTDRGRRAVRCDQPRGGRRAPRQ